MKVEYEITTDEIIPDFLILTTDFVKKMSQGEINQTTLRKLVKISQTSFIFVEKYEDGVNKHLQNFYVFPFKVSRKEFIDFFGAERTKVVNDVEDVEKLIEKKESTAVSTTASERQIRRGIPLLDTKREFAFFSTHIKNALVSVFSAGKFILGDEVHEFERRVSEYLGVRYSVGVASGTDALTISLRAISYARYGKEFFGDDELVITTPFTFVATAEAILRAGAKPIFVDVEPDTFNLSPEEIRKCLKKHGKKIRGLVVVHLFGHSADMGEIMKIARENELFVLEDVAQAFGGEFIQSDEKKVARKLGSIGDAGAFSFFPSKNLGGFGDGGLISTNDEKIAEISKMLRNHGGKDKYNVSILGFNSRLDTIQAGLLLGKLEKIDELNERRRRVANLYRKLVSTPKVKLPVEKKYAKHVYHQFTLVVSEDDGKDSGKGEARDKLKSLLSKRGIASAIYYPILLPDMELFKGRCEVFGELKVSRELTRKVISIPIHPFLRDDEVEFIARTLNSF